MRKSSSVSLYRSSGRAVSQSQHRLETLRTINRQLIPDRNRFSMADRHIGKAGIIGKGRFGKRALSFAVDLGGYSHDSNSNSNDSGVDFHSCESQFSWNSEDAHMGRSSSISNLSTISVPQFSISYGKTLCDDIVKEKQTNGSFNIEGTVTNLLDFNGGRLLTPEKALLDANMRMSPDSSDQSVNMVTQIPILGRGSHSPNSTSPTSTISPVPMKRARFSYHSQMPQFSSGKGTGLKLRNQNQSGRGSIGKRLPPGTAPTLTSFLSPLSRDGRVQLQIVSQPEEQHRARYQTEGSRGAIKDKKGNGFPTVKLLGYDKPATLQIFIGTDQGKVSPHMFYQACKVTGKSSTPCIEKKVEGTIVIEIEFEPSKEMVISCDCVGILKERNVDVEQRFPFQHASQQQSRKKSTKCRMIFRTTIINSQGVEETLQLSSSAILCTQPPGHPEICKQSTYDCPAKGGMELFVIGKNFLKDTKIMFQEEDADEQILWEAISEPLKDYLQQNHLVCGIPPYKNPNIATPVECKVTIISGGKQSEPHRFTYLPNISTAQCGISTPGSIPSSPVSPVLVQDVLVQSLSQGQQLMTLSIPDVGSMGSGSEHSLCHSMIPSSVTDGTIHSTLTKSELCEPLLGQAIHQAIVITTPTTNSIPMLPFTENIHSAPTDQECQVVNELQSILEQSVQQNQQQSENAVNDMLTTTLSIKPEVVYDNISQNSISSVPLDLQFPTDNVTVQPVQTTQSMVQASMNYGSQGMNNSQFVNTSSITCMNTTMTPMLSSTTSMDVNVQQQMLTELLPNPQVSLVDNIPPNSLLTTSTSNSNPISANCGSLQNTESRNGVLSTNCTVQTMVKMESQSSISTPHQMQMNGVMVPNQQNPQNFISGDLHAHQGTITNVITQMSDNELINYINPSCFEQNLSLV